MKDIHGGDIWRASVESGSPLTSIIDFSASINPLGPSPRALKAIKKALTLIPPYPDPASASLKEALSSFHSVDTEEVAVGNGSTEFIYLLPGVFRPPKALIVEPAFSEYRNALGLWGCKADSLVLREDTGFSFDLKRFKRKAQRGYGLIYLCNPANPTGSVADKETLLEAASVAGRYGSVLVVDEAFADFCEDRSIKKEAAGSKNIVVLRSMTKFFSMAGLRLGFLIANRRIIRKLSKSLPPWSVNTVASFAAEASLKDASYMERTRSLIASEKAFLINALKGVKGLAVYPSEANFLMLRLGSPDISAPDVVEALFRKGILVRDLSAFRGLGPRYLRVAVRKRDENTALVNGLRKFLGRSGG